LPGTVTPLAEAIREALATRGPIAFSDFMARALYDPGRGYYASGRASIGRAGDFYTNVSTGPIYAEIIARQAIEIWLSWGGPAHFDLVEQGAHDARFAADFLGWCRSEQPAFFAALHYRIVEPIRRAQGIQKQALADFPESVTWSESVADLPPISGLFFSNELVDALPVDLVEWDGSAWRQILVAADGPALSLVPGPPADSAALGALAGLRSLPAGYRTEVRPSAVAWIRDVAARLDRGVILICDYGFPFDVFYDPSRREGTLQCYRAHRKDSAPLGAVGEKDITAHVEFTSLARAALDAGLDLAGYTDQHHFMMGAALETLHTTGAAPDSPGRARRLRALKTLLHPELMGTQFKFLALSRDTTTPSGFRFARDARQELGLGR